jgi:hypothetical protein
MVDPAAVRMAGRLRELARPFPMSLALERRLKGDHELATEILAALPPHPELYWHGTNGKSCPCAGCCAGAGPILTQAVALTQDETGRTKRLAVASAPVSRRR